MNKDDFFYFGKIIKTHGIQGELSIRIDADQPARYSKLKMLFVDISGKPVPFFIRQLSIRNDKAYVMFEDIQSVEKALTLTGKNLYLPTDQLPRLKGNKFYFHEVTNFLLVDESFGELGAIVQVIPYPGQPVFQVFHKGKEVLIPLHDQIILKVDRRSKTITIKAPEGLIDMYLNP
ncbi:MAG TPA: ribosome maturation factor RimM [Bacteroidales bacterium]|nr:ribosome maturation factor RimM [Bacteroidales bacterium]